MAIRANALSVRDSIAPTAPLDLAGARDASQDILEAVDSASDLSQRLLTFAKPSNSATGYVNLDQAAQRVLHMMQRLVPAYRACGRTERWPANGCDAKHLSGADCLQPGGECD